MGVVCPIVLILELSAGAGWGWGGLGWGGGHYPPQPPQLLVRR